MDELDQMALEVIGRLNAWRLEEGLWPLKPNTTLTELAAYQANYLTSLPSLPPPTELHIGPQGREPHERAVEAPFLWPHYALPEQVSIGENAAQGNVDFAIQYWQGSPIHTRTALNPDYREVGVAVKPYKDSHIFIAVFGGRPNVLPALIDPRDGQTIYLTNETFRFASFYDAMQTATEVQLFDADGRPINEEGFDWAETIAAPTDAGNEVFLLINDAENHTIISPIHLAEDTVILPEALLAAATPQPTVEAIAAPTDEPETMATPEPSVEPTEETPTEVPLVAGEPDLRILYTNDTLSVLNISGDVADWRGLEFVGTIDYPFTNWERVTVFPLGAFPANHCLQIRSVSLTGAVEVPETCGWVRSLIQLGPDRLFWALDNFEVRYNGSTLATCEVNAGVCEVALP